MRLPDSYACRDCPRLSASSSSIVFGETVVQLIIVVTIELNAVGRWMFRGGRAYNALRVLMLVVMPLAHLHGLIRGTQGQARSYATRWGAGTAPTLLCFRKHRAVVDAFTVGS